VSCASTPNLQPNLGVIYCGRYGCGEGVLHPLFKAGWKGEQPVLPVLEGGKTVLPMIHVRDLAAIVVRISEKKPEQKEYARRCRTRPCFCNTLRMYLAVDDGRCKQADIVKAIASQLQDGSVVSMDTPQCVLPPPAARQPARNVRLICGRYLAWMSENDASTESHLLPLQLQLKARFSGKDALDVPWSCLSGAAEGSGNKQMQHVTASTNNCSMSQHSATTGAAQPHATLVSHTPPQASSPTWRK
jgi:hypothetical protein